ncbi:hypothetical protein Q3G72_014197 [Acer saccharum]|nr:hypothetical protein Q3G72_014197 [Acer saccharum]
MEILCVIIWKIWFRRNCFVHGQPSAPDDDLVPWAKAFLFDFRNANAGLSPSGGGGGGGVLRTLQGGKIGLGVVNRNFKSEVLASSASPVLVGYSFEVAEAGAVLLGLNSAIALGSLPCVVETNAFSVVNLIHDNCAPIYEIGIVVSDIKGLLVCHPECKIVFTSRSSNMVAHHLAKFGLRLDEAKFWLEEVPHCVTPIV